MAHIPAVFAAGERLIFTDPTEMEAAAENFFMAAARAWPGFPIRVVKHMVGGKPNDGRHDRLGKTAEGMACIVVEAAKYVEGGRIDQGYLIMAFDQFVAILRDQYYPGLEPEEFIRYMQNDAAAGVAAEAINNAKRSA